MAINTRSSKFARVGGFSVLEAVIVLAITGLALTIVFSIGSRASQMGFRLGRRVLEVSDTEVVAVGFHAIVSGLVVPSAVDSVPGQPFTPQPLQGDAQHLQAGAVAERKTVCGGEGPNGLIRLEVDNSDPDHAKVTCRAGDGPKTVLEDFGAHPVALSYSTDGENWTDRIDIVPGPPPPTPEVPLPIVERARILFVRLASADGVVLVVDRAWTGRPLPPPINPDKL